MNSFAINSSGRAVVKFGGSNLKTRKDLLRLVDIVKAYNKPVIIVVSALYGITDTLVDAVKGIATSESVIPELKKRLLKEHFSVIETSIKDEVLKKELKSAITERVEELTRYLRGAHYLGGMPDFASDMTQSYGERLSSLILNAVLNHRGVDSVEALPEDIGLVTDGIYGNATVNFDVSVDNLKKNLRTDVVNVVPGFYGVSEGNRITLLGRGGTDYSAAAIARCVGADFLDFWKDVSGFMSADPKITSEAKLIPSLSYSEAAELSYFGAKILHPRTFEPVRETGIEVNICNVDKFPENLRPGTVIGRSGRVSRDVIKSVTCSDNFAILKLIGPGVGIKPGIMAEATAVLSNSGINIRSVITSQTSINIMLSRDDIERGYKKMEELSVAGVDRLEKMDNISLVALVGEGIPHRPGVAGRIFGAISKENINVLIISMGASDVATYFVVDREDKLKAVKIIHKEFFNEEC